MPAERMVARVLVVGLVAVVAAMAGGAERTAAQVATIEAPVAQVIPERLEAHGHTRVDNYYWLNQRENPEVIASSEMMTWGTFALRGSS